MICTCKHCEKPFWRYRRDFPPHGFCSLPCYELGPAKAEQRKERPPIPEVVLEQMRNHRFYHHGTASILGIYDCRQCDELEADYAESLSYHYREATTELVNKGKQDWEYRVRGAHS